MEFKLGSVKPTLSSEFHIYDIFKIQNGVSYDSNLDCDF